MEALLSWTLHSQWLKGTVAVSNRLFQRLAAPLFFLCVAGLVAAVGGAFIESWIADPCVPHFLSRLAVILLLAAVAIALGIYLKRHDGRLFAFQCAFVFILGTVTLYAANWAVSLVAPRWPAIGLHGLRPKEYWRNGPTTRELGFNSWGQRDRERALTPAPGVDRIAFIGDSFVEESAVPLPYRVEEKLKSPRFEIVNLAVSASSPDEYYYRLKNIALRLGIKRCVLFFYTGNDLNPECTLRSFRSIAAVYPRDSLLSLMGLTYLNHLLTNSRRPFLAAWGEGGRYSALESSRQSAITTSDADSMRTFLLSLVDEKFRSKLTNRLALADPKPFIDAVRRPDENLFRSYYLEAALRFAAGQIKKYPHVSEQHSYAWVRRAAELCEQEGVDFTLVVIPDAFQVDSRMQRQYGAVADMRDLFAARYDAAQRLIDRARADGIDVLDLAPLLSEHPGSYLNLDGHWSKQGIEVVSDALVATLNSD